MRLFNIVRHIFNMSCLLTLAASQIFFASADEPRTIVASIKPLHSLVAGVMGDRGQPTLIVSGANSEHDYALRPSDAAVLEGAARLFWLGPTLEGFLDRPVRALDPGVSVELGLHIKKYLYPRRTNESFIDEARLTRNDDKDEEAGHGHSHVGADGQPLLDLHAWLDPVIASALVDVIADELAKAEPANAPDFRINAAALKVRLTALDAEIAASLEPVKKRPFMVFHDAYQYFEARYGLHNAGALSINPEHPPGARHLDALRKRVEHGDIVCVFAEPQFEPKLVRTLVEGTVVRSATLDPLGIDQPEGPEAYFGLIRTLATSLRMCLDG